MLKMINPINLASAGFAIAAGFTLVAFTGTAEAAQPKRLCESGSYARTAACCDGYIKKNKLFGNSSGAMCHGAAAITCVTYSAPPSAIAYNPGAAKKKCYVNKIILLKRRTIDKGGSDSGTGRGTPSNNNPNGGNNPSRGSAAPN
jgi:hypothetical protein